MYIELLCRVNVPGDGPIEAELVGATQDEYAEYVALVRLYEGYILSAYHPSRVTILEKPLMSDPQANGLVALMLKYGAKLEVK